MGYSYETVPNQHRPLRSDRTQPPSNEPYSYYGHEQRFHSNYEHFVSQQLHSTETSHSDGAFVRASRSLKQPPTVHVDQEDEGSRTQGADQDDHEPEKQLLSFQRRTVAVLEQYSAIVLDTLSQLISRHVASDKRLRDGLLTGSTSGNDSITDDEEPTLTPSSRGSTSNEPHRRPPSSRTCAPDALLAPLHEMGSCGRSKVSCPAPSVSQRTPPSSSLSSLASSSSPSTPVTKSTSSHHLVRHSLCLYAASSVLLALCYLTIPTVASDTAHPIFAEGKSDKEILDHLLKNSRYDKRLLPPVDGTLTVNVSVLLLSLASPDESSLKYEVEFLLQQQWFDPRLRYANQSQYEYLNAIHHHEDIWLPDTYFIMHGDFKDPIIPMHFALRIYRNGTINYLMRRHLILSCQGRLNIFPFDDPLCSFALESISYEQSAITYVWKNDEDTLRKSPSLTTLNAYLIQNQTIACPIKASWRGNYSCLKVDLIFTRDRAFYFTTVFIPGIILVTSSFITFWLEWNAVPARSMIGVTTMLNFFTTSNGFRSTLPVVSNLTAMNVWDGVCMCFIYASLLEFVCVNYVGRKRPLHNVVYRPGENPVTQRLPAVLSRIGIILASPLGVKKRESGGPNEIVACTSCAGGTSPCTHSANNGCATETCFVQVRKKEPPHPIRVAKTIDVIARITFPSAYAVFLIFFFIHYKGFS
ncbi:glutamate-gated chloride channel isoform X7 [Anopheles darlingi]|uniref:glutamate-gated chloride channel isoform X7 n=1 Tax=Anopheles darlingi TaxID=43151 RepID=UPI0021000B64|nr:glutamate-gated chloride channel isoform X7 [Anopheles darlingi]